MLTNDRVTLRALEPTDIDTIYRWENDSRLWLSGSAAAPFSRKQVWDYIAGYTADPYASGELRLMITDTQSREPLGMVDITNFDPVNRRGQVGIMVDIAHQRLGVGSAALELLASYSRNLLGMHQLWAIIPADNAASRALFERRGYAIEGHLRSWLRVGREYRDAYLYHRFLQ